jgi:two-component system, sensor histidine kinase RegB
LAASISSISLRWFIRLRWIAACGQALCILIAHFHFGLVLPWSAMLGILLVTVLTNHWIQDSHDWSAAKSHRRLVTVIVMDLLLLTLMLYFTGGIHNPFVGFYLPLIAVAAMTLSTRALALALAVSGGGMFLIARCAEPLRGAGVMIDAGHLGYPFYWKASLISLLMIGGCMTYFLQRMNRSLKVREEALAEAERKIAECQRYQSLATLAAGVAHELGSPLGTIAIASKDLMRQLQQRGMETAVCEDAELIRSEVERCRMILKRLDQTSTRGVGEAMRECTVPELMAQLQRMLPEKIFNRLEMTDLTQSCRIITAVDAVVQSLVVLIENAAEADPKGNRILLSIRIGPHQDLVFQVQDFGRGITETERWRIGEPFFTTKKDQSGMGLGLFLVRTLTANLGGSCVLHPSAQGGTLATLTLPQHSELP